MRLLLCLCISAFSFAQQGKELTAIVVNAAGNLPMSNVNVLNINKVLGSVTDKNGEFSINASINDTLYISFLGFKSLKVRITGDMFKFKTRIQMTELAYALEEVVVRPYTLTGDLYIDAKNIPFNIAPQYSISGLSTTGYEGGGDLNIVGKMMKAIFNPADFLYDTFSRRSKQMRKLKKMRQSQEIRRLLADKFDRETLTTFLDVNKGELESVLRNCNYSKGFITNANDLQVLEAISDCYEEYKILKKSVP